MPLLGVCPNPHYVVGQRPSGIRARSPPDYPMIRNHPTDRGSTPPDSFEFDRTLSPSDAGLRVVSPTGAERERVVVPGHTFPEEPSLPSSFRERETLRDLPSRDDPAATAVTPAAGSEYVPPRAAPLASAHKTIETELVQLDPGVHPRTAQTIMDARRRARAAMDPAQVPTQAMPIQKRRAMRRRLMRAAAVVLSLGAGGVLALALQGGSFGSVGDAARVTVLPALVTPETETRRSERPTLAIDVREDPRQEVQAELPVGHESSTASSPSTGELGSPHAAQMRSPWASQAPAGEVSAVDKGREKRAVWLE